MMPIIGVGLVLFALNIYQYFQVKQQLSTTLVQSIAVSDLREIKNYFKNFELKLKIAREWGKNGLLDIEKTADLNKKFIPFLQEQSNIAGIIIADTSGREYYLIARDGKIVTRNIDRKNKQGTASFVEWSAPDRAEKKWEEKIPEYDSRTRPWFRTDLQEGAVFFSPIYTFNSTGKKGITASASWQASDDPADLFVVGLDIRLADIRTLLASINENKKTSLFLVNGNNNAILSDNIDKTEEPESVQISETVLKNLVEIWRKEGKPSSMPISLSAGKVKYLATLQPVNEENQTVWVGVAASEEALLSSVNSSFLSFELTDFLVVVAGGIVFLIILIRYRPFDQGGSKKSKPLSRVQQALSKGEGNRVEFKSTVRMNLKSGKNGKEIELAWLKAVVAFLNSQGGTLLIGVNDEGDVLGLEADGFENDDKCLLHLKNCLHQHIGAEFSPFISVRIVAMKSALKLILIEVDPSTSHAF